MGRSPKIPPFNILENEINWAVRDDKVLKSLSCVEFREILTQQDEWGGSKSSCNNNDDNKTINSLAFDDIDDVYIRIGDEIITLEKELFLNLLKKGIVITKKVFNKI